VAVEPLLVAAMARHLRDGHAYCCVTLSVSVLFRSSFTFMIFSTCSSAEQSRIANSESTYDVSGLEREQGHEVT
jgi:hypothetical protein